MDEYLANETLRNQSVALLLVQFPANVIWTSMTVVGLFTSSFLLILTMMRRQLRTVNQTTVLALAINDLLQAIGFGLLGVKRLYYTSHGMPEMNSKRGCMIWMLLLNFSHVLSGLILVCSAVERVLALAKPVWFRSHRAMLPACLLSAVVLVALGATLLAVLSAMDDELTLACTLVGSSSALYRLVYAYVFNGCTGVVVVLNGVIAAMLYRRYRRAMKKRLVETFKRDVEANALKSLATISALFCVSSFGGSVFGSALSQSSLSEYRKSSLGPITGCMQLLHIVFDSLIYVYFGTEYRLAARKLFARVLVLTSLPSSQVPAIRSSINNNSRVGVANTIKIQLMTSVDIK